MEAVSTATKIPTASPASHENKPDVSAKDDAIKMLPPVFYQAKLTVGAPDDPLEKEADDMADKVMRMPLPDPISFSSGKNIVSRKCAECEEEEKLHRKESNSDSTFAAPSIVQDVLNSSGGKSLDANTRSFMEPRFNYDFSNVKIHDNDLAANSADSINALAYTSGNNVIFNSGQYNTDSESGKRLLAHELTHVVQQSDSSVRRQEDTDSAYEPLLGNQPAKFIVEDDMEPGEGQMRKSEFLERLNTEICSTVDETMQGTPFSSDNCPYIRAAFARHYNSTPLQLQQLLERYAPEAAFAQGIDEVIEEVKIRVAAAAAQWLQNGGNLSEVSDEATSLVAGGSEGENSEGIFLKENSAGGKVSDSPASVMNSLGKGSPLDGSTRNKMESAFGTSFSDVEVHTDSRASSLSSNMNARAFAVGNHIAFSNGEHQPGSLVGDALMAHELAHVVQQKGAGSSTGYSDNMLEEDADQTAIGVMTKMMSGKDIDLFRKENKGLKTGLRLSRCDPKKSTPTPAPTCANPGVTRTLALQPVFIKCGAADADPTGGAYPTMLAKANLIWGKLGVTFTTQSPVLLDDCASKTSGTTEAQQNAIGTLHTGPGIEIYYVDNNITGAGGASTLAAREGSNIVLSDFGTSDTLLAHELGHVLTNSTLHPPDIGEANTILQPSNSHSTPNPERNTIGNYAFIVYPAGSTSICLHPDP